MTTKTGSCKTCLNRAPLCANGYCIGYVENPNLDDDDRDRISGREWCRELLTALAAESEAYQAGFWRHVKRQLDPQELDRGAMSDSKAREFGQEVLDFGKHRGKTYDDTPLDYLEWLADEGEKLARYVRSRRVKEEAAE